MIFNLEYLKVLSAEGGGEGTSLPPLTEADFSYTGRYTYYSEGGNNWRITFWDSGTFKLLNLKNASELEIYAVGGGGGGGAGGYDQYEHGGWGFNGEEGSVLEDSMMLYLNTDYPVVIGTGGAGGKTDLWDVNLRRGTSGKPSSFADMVASPGEGGSGWTPGHPDPGNPVNRTNLWTDSSEPYGKPGKGGKGFASDKYADEAWPGSPGNSGIVMIRNKRR